MFIDQSSARARARYSDGSPLPMLAAFLHGVKRTLDLWRQRRSTRRVLATFDDRQLADLGITRAQAREEAAVPFWR